MGFEFYYILFTFIANMHRFFSLKDKKGIAITNYIAIKGNEFNKRSIKPFFFFRIIIQKCIQHRMKKNLLLVKDSLKP